MNLSSQVSRFLKNVTVFSILNYKYGCNTLWHKGFIMIHLLVDSLG